MSQHTAIIIVSILLVIEALDKLLTTIDFWTFHNDRQRVWYTIGAAGFIASIFLLILALWS